MTILDGMRSVTSESKVTNSNEHFQAYRKAASFVLSTLSAHKKESPKIGIVCGSGLSGLSSCLTDTLKISYASIPGFPVSITHRLVTICMDLFRKAEKLGYPSKAIKSVPCYILFLTWWILLAFFSFYSCYYIYNKGSHDCGRP
jgi:hypothetical protein